MFGTSEYKVATLQARIIQNSPSGTIRFSFDDCFNSKVCSFFFVLNFAYFILLQIVRFSFHFDIFDFADHKIY